MQEVGSKVRVYGQLGTITEFKSSGQVQVLLDQARVSILVFPEHLRSASTSTPQFKKEPTTAVSIDSLNAVDKSQKQESTPIGDSTAAVNQVTTANPMDLHKPSSSSSCEGGAGSALETNELLQVQFDRPAADGADAISPESMDVSSDGDDSGAVHLQAVHPKAATEGGHDAPVESPQNASTDSQGNKRLDQQGKTSEDASRVSPPLDIHPGTDTGGCSMVTGQQQSESQVPEIIHATISQTNPEKLTATCEYISPQVQIDTSGGAQLAPEGPTSPGQSSAESGEAGGNNQAIQRQCDASDQSSSPHGELKSAGKQEQQAGRPASEAARVYESLRRARASFGPGQRRRPRFAAGDWVEVACRYGKLWCLARVEQVVPRGRASGTARYHVSYHRSGAHELGVSEADLGHATSPMQFDNSHGTGATDVAAPGLGIQLGDVVLVPWRRDPGRLRRGRVQSIGINPRTGGRELAVEYLHVMRAGDVGRRMDSEPMVERGVAETDVVQVVRGGGLSGETGVGGGDGRSAQDAGTTVRNGTHSKQQPHASHGHFEGIQTMTRRHGFGGDWMERHASGSPGPGPSTGYNLSTFDPNVAYPHMSRVADSLVDALRVAVRASSEGGRLHISIGASHRFVCLQSADPLGTGHVSEAGFADICFQLGVVLPPAAIARGIQELKQAISEGSVDVGGATKCAPAASFGQSSGAGRNLVQAPVFGRDWVPYVWFLRACLVRALFHGTGPSASAVVTRSSEGIGSKARTESCSDCWWSRVPLPDEARQHLRGDVLAQSMGKDDESIGLLSGDTDLLSGRGAGEITVTCASRSDIAHGGTHLGGSGIGNVAHSAISEPRAAHGPARDHGTAVDVDLYESAASSKAPASGALASIDVFHRATQAASPPGEADSQQVRAARAGTNSSVQVSSYRVSARRQSIEWRHRLLQLQEAQDDWRKGDRLECRFGPRRLFYPGRVLHISPVVRRLKVQFDDGAVREGVPMPEVRERFDPGDIVSVTSASDGLGAEVGSEDRANCPRIEMPVPAYMGGAGSQYQQVGRPAPRPCRAVVVKADSSRNKYQVRMVGEPSHSSVGVIGTSRGVRGPRARRAIERLAWVKHEQLSHWDGELDR